MIVQLPAAVIDADPANLEEMSGFLAQAGLDVVMRLRDVQQLELAISKASVPPLLVVNLDPDPGAALARLAAVMQRHPQLDVFAMSESTDPQLLMEAMHVGIREFIALPVQADRLRRGIERVARSRSVAAASEAKVIVFVPTSGGCGTTTAACNVAVGLAAKGRTALIDLDLVGGAVAEALDLQPRFSIADVAQGQIDRNLVANALTVHKATGLSVLARPEMPEEALRVDAAAVSRLLRAVAGTFEYIVVDSVLSVDPVHMAAVRAAEEVVMVLQLNVPGVRSAARYLKVLQRAGVPIGTADQPGRVRLVAGRSAKRGNEVTQEAAAKALGLKIDWSIPSDFRSAIDAINYGEPLVLRTPRAEVSASLTGLAHLLNGRLATAAEVPQRGGKAAVPKS